jgi:excisionase family DNA binding protein
MGGPDAVQDASELWDIEEVAAYLKVPVGSVYHMTKRKAGLRIPHVKLGSRLRFQKTAIDEWLGLLSVSNVDLLAKARTRARTKGG